MLRKESSPKIEDEQVTQSSALGFSFKLAIIPFPLQSLKEYCPSARIEV